MTIYKTVVSWLALFCLVWYGIDFGWELLRWFVGRFAPAWAGGGNYQKISFGDLCFSFAFAAAAGLLMVPWLRFFLIWRGRSPSAMTLTEALAGNLNTLGRWLLVVFFFYWTFKGVWAAAILAALLAAPEVAVLASSGFTGFIDAVFFPGGREKIPPYTIKLARFYVEKQRWDEAEAEFARVLSYHPDKLEAWQERLSLAFLRPVEGDPAPEEVLAGALRSLRQPADREAIHAHFTRHRP